jgi:ElaB/YqjD/DUF883 family membrane-anchored ribosome-binding protein
MAAMSDIPAQPAAAASESFPPDETEIHAEIIVLREKVEALMTDRVAPAVVSAAYRAEAAAHRAADVIADRAEQLSAMIRERPLTAIAASAFAGYFFAALRRR